MSLHSMIPRQRLDPGLTTIGASSGEDDHQEQRDRDHHRTGHAEAHTIDQVADDRGREQRIRDRRDARSRLGPTRNRAL